MREVMTGRLGQTALVGMLWCLVLPLSAAPPRLHVEGNKIKDPGGNEVVLRGISLIDLGFLESWQGGVIPMIDRITKKDDPQGTSPGWYPKVLRLPIHPADSVTGWPNRWKANDDTFYTGLLRPVVDYCATKDLYVILDWHYISDTGPKMTQTSEFWRYMAPRFANDSHVFFELFNEPMNNVGSERQRWLSVKADMQTWVNIVRSYAADNLILVGGAQWCQILAPTVTDPIVGSHIVYVSHFYPAHWLGIYSNRMWITNQLQTCAAAHPVMMTEWGFTTTTETLLKGTITNYGQPLVDLMERLGLGSTAWVASNTWGPPMFWPNWTLRCGEGEMGCFVKDMLYQKRNDKQPQGTAGVNLYLDAVAAGITATPGQTGILDYNCPDQPAVGNRCLHWTGVDRFSTISFVFTSAKDLSADVREGSVVELWVRGDTPGVRLDLRFVDTQTGKRGDHPWRMRYALDPGAVQWNGDWQRLQIPLRQFAEQGAADGGHWYDPVGAFDWKAVDRFEIAADYHDLRGIHLYFDNIRVITPGP